VCDVERSPIQRAGTEFRKIVEKEHAVMRQRQFAGTCSVLRADHGCRGHRVVWCPKWALRDQCIVRESGSGGGVMGRDAKSFTIRRRREERV
jgi:hypothetical protein